MRVRIFYFNQELTDFKNEEERLCGTSGNDKPKYSWLRSKKVHVVDLGSRTVNYLGNLSRAFYKAGFRYVRQRRPADQEGEGGQTNFNSAVDQAGIQESEDVLILAGGGTAFVAFLRR